MGDMIENPMVIGEPLEGRVCACNFCHMDIVPGDVIFEMPDGDKVHVECFVDYAIDQLDAERKVV